VSPPKDKRAVGPRAQVELDVDLSTYGKYFLSKLENVSAGGAFVRTREVYPVGTDVKLRFTLPNDNATIEAAGEVIWSYNQAGRTEPNSSGMGIKFTKIQDEDRVRITRFVEESTRN